MTKKIFLGGTANNSTWRETLIPLLDPTKISYFNPVVPDWNEQVQQEEIKQRKTCDFVLYTITKEMEGFYAIAEVVDDSNKRPTKTIFCYLEEGFSKHQIKSLQATARMVKENGAKVFTSLEEVAEYLNRQQLEDELKSLVEKAGGEKAVEDYFLSQNEPQDRKNKKIKINFGKKKTSKTDQSKNNLSDKLTEEEITRMEQLWKEIKQKEAVIQIPPK